MKIYIYLLVVCSLTINVSFSQPNTKRNDLSIVRLKEGRIMGIALKSGVMAYRGIPYAEAPVGDLRWRSPVPKKKWSGVRKAFTFAPRSPQRDSYDDMVFRSAVENEDCLYLNVWRPSAESKGPFPVVVYFHGGGFASGDGSEARYDGESMARQGIIFITINYRLSVFGFLAHPELSKEGKLNSSGNYGLQDQSEALRWVKNNIAAFGGNPGRVTIAGESAGSMSVSAQMCSPLSKGLFQGAIGQSGSILGFEPPISLVEAEKIGIAFAKACGAGNIAGMRKIPAKELLRISKNYWFPLTIDGYFFTQAPLEVYRYGRQVDIPLLAGWTSAERSMNTILGNNAPTVINYRAGIDRMFGLKSAEISKLYNASSDDQVEQLATDLSGDSFIAYGTWKWIDIHGKTNGYPVYRYLFTRKRPAFVGKGSNNADRMGAVHASDIEYALGNLKLNRNYKWEAGDFETSRIFQSYLVNFIKTGNPNNSTLPKWFGLQSSIPKVMYIDSLSRSTEEKNGKRYSQLDAVLKP